MGRPRYYTSPEEMEQAIDAYFDNYPNPTITGLILELGFAHREALLDYEKREGFSDIIKKARLRVENGYEKALYRVEGQVTGAIFALKNMGWKDKTEVVSETTHRLIMTDDAGNEIDKEKSDI